MAKNNDELKTKETESLFQAVLALESELEVELFMRDLCTISELKAMAERWNVAQQVDKKVPYRKINVDTGSSTATITRVAHWLHHGMGGYRLMLDRLKK